MYEVYTIGIERVSHFLVGCGGAYKLLPAKDELVTFKPDVSIVVHLVEARYAICQRCSLCLLVAAFQADHQPSFVCCAYPLA